MSKVQKKTAFRMTVAKRMREYGVPEGGSTLVVESGTALIDVPASTVESLRANVNRLHAERGAAVLDAKKSREEQGFKSAAFQLDWQHVEDLTRAIVHYEGELDKALANNVETPLKRAAVAAMDLFDVIDKLSDEDAAKAIEVVKQRAKVSMLGRSMRKAVPA